MCQQAILLPFASHDEDVKMSIKTKTNAMADKLIALTMDLRIKQHHIPTLRSLRTEHVAQNLLCDSADKTESEPSEFEQTMHTKLQAH